MKKQTLVTILAATACSALVFAAVALAATIRGTQGNDDLTNQATAGPDKIIAKKGNDVGDAKEGDDYVNAGGGNDEFNGDAGEDRMTGKAGDDTLNGGDNNDSLSGKAGADALNGDEGDDFLAGGKGVDQLDGGPGNDTIKSRGDGKTVDDPIDCGVGDRDTVKLGHGETSVGCEIVEDVGGS